MGSDLIMESPDKSTSLKQHHDPIPCKQPTVQQLNLNNKETECLAKLHELIRGNTKKTYTCVTKQLNNNEKKTIKLHQLPIKISFCLNAQKDLYNVFFFLKLLSLSALLLLHF